MAGTDIAGRAYAKIGSLKAGDKVQVDGDFDCIAKNKIMEVGSDGDGLYIPCKKGKHYLAGQKQGRIYLGVYPVAS